jgi:hypothetical protein
MNVKDKLRPFATNSAFCGGFKPWTVCYFPHHPTTRPHVTSTPAYETIISCITKEEIAGLVTEAAAQTNFITTTSILPAPWLLEAVRETNSNDPTTLILAASDAAAKFDREYKYNDEYITEAEEVFANFTRWMWAIQANHIPKTNYVVEPENEELSNHAILRHHQHINQTPS